MKETRNSSTKLVETINIRGADVDGIILLVQISENSNVGMCTGLKSLRMG
jgi:hypothetical protein